MKKISFVIGLFILSIPVVKSQDINFDPASIPSALKQNAHTVKRYENTVLTVESASKATLHVHEVITVLNEDGRRALAFSEYTSKFRSLKNVEIKVYNVAGKEIGKYRKKDMQTVAVGEGLIEDGEMTYFVVTGTPFPVTVDYDYEIELDGTLNLPAYSICTTDEGVQEAHFIARVTGEVGFRYLAKNTSIVPEITTDGRYTVYTWSVKNLPPLEWEEGGASVEDRYPSLLMAVNRFSFSGFSGDLSSWKGFGEWLRSLYTGLDELPQARKDFFISLVKDAKTDRDKASIIYNYLQRNFRYVSIQLGIGGYKPFSAEFTDQKKYGDCKALSNFMKAALKAVGVRSHLAIINAGYNNEPVDPAFPVNDFNHVIVCIPEPGASIWLECTSSTADFGKLGTFTENRNALLVTDNGGQLVATPASKSKENLFIASTHVKLADDGSGETETIFHCTGACRQMLDMISKEKKDEQKESLVSDLSFKQPDDFIFSQEITANQQVNNLKMAVEKIPEFTAGSKLFLPQRIYKIWAKKLPKTDHRNIDYFFYYPFEISDTTAYELPPGYTIEVLPPAKQLSCEFGEYNTKYWYNEAGKTVYTTAVFVLKQHAIPAEKYAVVKKFFDDIMTNETERLVIRKE